MRNKYFPNKFLACLAVFLLILGFMLVSVDFIALNRNFYRRQFAKHDVATEAELSDAELVRVMEGLIAYFSDQTDDLQIEVTFIGMEQPIPFYTEDELRHMHDVKVVFLAVRIGGYVCTVAGIIILFALTSVQSRLKAQAQKSKQESTQSPKSKAQKRRECARILSRAAIGGGAAFLVVIALIAIGAAFFFEPLFNFFHLIAFPQGNWQFDYDSNMLAVLPEPLFQAAAIAIALNGIITALAMMTVGIVVRTKIRAE